MIVELWDGTSVVLETLGLFGDGDIGSRLCPLTFPPSRGSLQVQGHQLSG